MFRCPRSTSLWTGATQLPMLVALLTRLEIEDVYAKDHALHIRTADLSRFGARVGALAEWL